MFKNATIVNRPHLRGVQLTGMRQVNLIVGPNGSGKTGVLNAIGLLAAHGRFTPEDVLRGSGEDEEPEVFIDGAWNGHPVRCTAEEPDRDAPASPLCPVNMSPPGHPLLIPLAESVLPTGIIERAEGSGVSDFIRRKIDPEHSLARVVGGQSGSGARRIWESVLSCYALSGGVLLVDGLEGPVHPFLFEEWAGLLVKAAEESGTQIVAVTYSKELIDAFALGEGYRNVMAYAIMRNAEGKKVWGYSGEGLRQLHTALNFDLRGVM